MNKPASIATDRTKIKPTNAVRCKFCGKLFDLSDEGNTYSDGTAAHEFCADEDAFEKANAGDFRD